MHGPSALTKTCPSCRVKRGYNETMLLRGVDDFITEVQIVIQTQDEWDNHGGPSRSYHVIDYYKHHLVCISSFVHFV